jgi:hypothetical protein
MLLRPVLALAAIAALAFLTTTATLPAAAPEAERYWHRWRGPLDTGEAPHAKPPLAWGDGKNVRWKVDVPGYGKSTPIVWGDWCWSRRPCRPAAGRLRPARPIRR